MSITIFHARLGLVQVPQEVRRDMLRRTCVFASDAIYELRSAFMCIQVTKRRCTIFHARLAPVRILERARRDTIRRTCVVTSGVMYGLHSVFGCVWGMKR
jgi:hypothetical protein